MISFILLWRLTLGMQAALTFVGLQYKSFGHCTTALCTREWKRNENMIGQWPMVIHRNWQLGFCNTGKTKLKTVNPILNTDKNAIDQSQWPWMINNLSIRGSRSQLNTSHGHFCTFPSVMDHDIFIII